MRYVPPILAMKLKIKIKNLVELNTNIYILFYYITLTFHSKIIFQRSEILHLFPVLIKSIMNPDIEVESITTSLSLRVLSREASRCIIMTDESGARTDERCSHIMTVIWYLAYGYHIHNSK